MAETWILPKPDPLACYCCGLLYGGLGWMDAVVPDDVWLEISPTGDGGGILCITCMARRCDARGIQSGIYIGSGPFADTQTSGACSGPYHPRVALRSLELLICEVTGWPRIWQATAGDWWAERISDRAGFITVRPLAEILGSTAAGSAGTET